MIDYLKSWYRGRYIPPPENSPNDYVHFISPGQFEQPLLAKVLSWFFAFWVKNWQFIVGTLVAIFLAIFFN